MRKPGPKSKDMTGERFGRLLVEEEDLSRPGHGARWRCRCDCGAHVTVRGDQLRCGNTTSCGCRSREALSEGRTRHGFSSRQGDHPLYRAWEGMIARCHARPGSKAWKDYVLRGIQVCDRWRVFENFLEDMQLTWREGLSLDRVDNDLGYFPGNCRWATRREQQRNRRANVRVSTPLGSMLLCDAELLWSRDEARAFERLR